MANKNLNKAKEAKKDESYTQLEDINIELLHYRDYFQEKIVLCNCDDPRVSNFFKYFAYYFEFLGLKKLKATCYKNQDWNIFSEGNSEKAVYLVYKEDKNGNHFPDYEEIESLPVKGDGEFHSPECVEFLKEALEKQIHYLMEDDEIMKKSGIYRDVFSRDLCAPSFLNFDKKEKSKTYEGQSSICVHYGKHFELEEMEADHNTLIGEEILPI